MTSEDFASEEHPFTSAMEREPVCDTTVLRFEVDGLKAKVEDIKVKTSEVAAAAMKAVKAAMGMVPPDRGPDPDDNYREDDDIRRLASIIERLAQRPPSNDYHESPKESASRTVIVSCTIAIISAFIVGAWQVSMRVTAVEVQVKNDADAQARWQASTDRRLDRLEMRP